MCGVQSGELLEDGGPGLALLRGVVNARDGVPHLMVPCQVGDVHPPPLVLGVLETLQAGAVLSDWQQEGLLEFKCSMVASSLGSSQSFVVCMVVFPHCVDIWAALQAGGFTASRASQYWPRHASQMVTNWLAAVIWTSENFRASMSLLLAF